MYLTKKGYEVIYASSPERRREVSVAPDTFSSAYLCHHGDHWFALRNVNKRWYQLDSLTGPERLDDASASQLVLRQLADGASLLAIRRVGGGTGMPEPDLSNTRQLRKGQHYLTD
eukprot:GHVU01049269.1.p3 GENE.GHVU01049269.1~~GHVU01049269.1.p3  ORF type:complete len:115 (-),score=25.07 GHVU01049269.1:24-368(-)